MTDIELARDFTPAPAAPAQPSTWDVLERQANVLAQSGIVPSQYQGKPNDIIAAGLMGHEVGWGVMTSLQLIHVVEGKPEVSAEGMVALIRRAGHSLKGTVSPEGAYVSGRRGDSGDEMEYSFTQEDAKRADLAGKQNWRRYPSSMLWARAVSQLGRMLFPDVLLGVSYVHGEISGADFDLGEPIVPPPVDGVLDASGSPMLMEGPEVYPSDAEVAELLELVRSLDDDTKAALKAEGVVRTRPGKYSWSFRSDHRWTTIELNDARSWIYGRIGVEPWDEAPAPAVVDPDETVIDLDEAPAEPQSLAYTADEAMALVRSLGHVPPKAPNPRARERALALACVALDTEFETLEEAMAEDGAAVMSFITSTSPAAIDGEAQ